MKKLNSTTDVSRYLEQGFLTKPFLEDSYVLEKVMHDFNAKRVMGKNITKIDSLIAWIHAKTMVSKDEEYKKQNKFQRTAQEIARDQKMTGCTDYAMLFATFARQIGIPTTILHTAEEKWLQRLLNGEDCKMHIGHSFCECFYEGKWILVDPTAKRTEDDYDPERIVLSYDLGGDNVFIPYFRGNDLGGKQTIGEHNKAMDQYCRKLFSY